MSNIRICNVLHHNPKIHMIKTASLQVGQFPHFLFDSLLWWIRKGGFPDEYWAWLLCGSEKVQSLYIRELWVKIRNPLNQQLGNVKSFIIYTSAIRRVAKMTVSKSILLDLQIKVVTLVTHSYKSIRIFPHMPICDVTKIDFHLY
jgi:hypothetical protein